MVNLKCALRWAIVLCLGAALLTGCLGGGSSGSTEFEYTFEDGDEGWVADFADLPADYDPAIYELESSWEPLPEPLEGHGMYMQGHNRSDDLFMFLVRRVDGLEPNDEVHLDDLAMYRVD